MAGLAEEVKRNRWELKAAVERLMPESRTATCSRLHLAGHMHDGEFVRSSGVSIFESDGKTFFSGLETCSSVWACPICAAKISERRRAELIEMQTRWESAGGLFRFMTLTFPHHNTDSLSELMMRFAAAKKRLLQSRTWRAWCRAIGLEHSITALEITCGENGWHIHAHCVLFLRSGCAECRAEDLLPTWRHCCRAAGLPEPNSRGLDIRRRSAAVEYVTKWGLDLELTKQHIKRGRGGHCTPFDLLRAYADGSTAAGDLFSEFTRVFKGRRQLVCSPGLRQAMGVQDKSDAQLAEEQQSDAVLVAVVPVEEWKIVVRYDLRYALLHEARERGKAGVQEYLALLVSGESTDAFLSRVPLPLFDYVEEQYAEL